MNSYDCNIPHVIVTESNGNTMESGGALSDTAPYSQIFCPQANGLRQTVLSEAKCLEQCAAGLMNQTIKNESR